MRVRIRHLRQRTSVLKIALFSICVLCVESQEPILAQTISTKPLTAGTPIRIELNPAITTTLLFPGQIAGTFGLGLVSGQASTGGSVQIEHPEGADVLILHALTENARVLATVLLNNKLYVLNLIAGPMPDVAVTFVTSDAANDSTVKKAVPVTPDEIKAARPQYSVEALLGVLRRARDNGILRPLDNEAYVGYAKRDAQYTSQSDTYKTTVTTIHKFSKEDAVVLQGVAENTTDHPLAFDGMAVTVEVANEIHPAKITDAYSPIPAHGKTLIDVVIQGDADGGRANLSIDNDYRIILPVRNSIWNLKSGARPDEPFKVPPPVKRVPLTQRGMPKRDTQ